MLQQQNVLFKVKLPEQII
jgi:hypothetical protein